MNKSSPNTIAAAMIGVSSSKYKSLLLGILSGFSMFYFLYFFGAYDIQKGVSYSGHTHLFRSMSFGLLTLIYLAIFESWLKPRRVYKNVKLKVLWYLGLVFFGSQLVFLLFNYFWNWQEWNIESYGLIMKEFPLMMLLPFLVYLGLIEVWKPKASKDVFLLFQSENGKDQLKLKLQDFLYAHAAENYVSIQYISHEEKKQHLVRKPLKTLEQELQVFTEIQRVHRSFLVNTLNIQAVKQAKGKVFLEIQSESIPVAKSHQASFLNH